MDRKDLWPFLPLTSEVGNVKDMGLSVTVYVRACMSADHSRTPKIARPRRAGVRTSSCPEVKQVLGRADPTVGTKGKSRVRSQSEYRGRAGTAECLSSRMWKSSDGDISHQLNSCSPDTQSFRES